MNCLGVKETEPTTQLISSSVGRIHDLDSASRLCEAVCEHFLWVGVEEGARLCFSRCSVSEQTFLSYIVLTWDDFKTKCVSKAAIW